jgi:hypothetical protein
MHAAHLLLVMQAFHVVLHMVIALNSVALLLVYALQVQRLLWQAKLRELAAWAAEMVQQTAFANGYELPWYAEATCCGSVALA